MRITVKIDSATPSEIYDLTLAFQRTSKGHEMPAQITVEPTVTVAGTSMGWESPALRAGHVEALLAEFASMTPELPEWERELLYGTTDW